MPKGQEQQLELDFGDLSLHVLMGKAQVDAGSVDVPMSQLLLKGIQTSTTIQEVNRVAVPEEVGMDIALKSSAPGGRPDELIRPLLRDVATLPRRKKVVTAFQTILLTVEKDRCDQAILDEYHPLDTALPEEPDAISPNVT